jgi:glc operon protein GlcG
MASELKIVKLSKKPGNVFTGLLVLLKINGFDQPRSNFQIVFNLSQNHTHMNTIGKVSSAEALQLIAHVVKEATSSGKSVVVAVAGPEGELISFIRMDDVNAGSGIIAPNKAYTAARQRKFTREIGKKMQDENVSPAWWGDDRITGFGGGVPIFQNDKVIGGIGVSGLSSLEDEELAVAAIKAVFG